ncbi:MAG TPA: bifunctional proline dehydrogenase/L-glutamate gamma-semialdehyde dehydrogenase PutA [Candidatus Competibacter sp.]|nr:bifunctional proline dehydrogenase/L-glutamate gamma-semialdehyde dehydrogenase PutA [Candidatus Competibacter sp.]HUM94282.1 bifunctional proline dehydrogenase/L-glutamate gamma-semialdehyde dehydrogenase PutA [Candidatus Competibacter sp.]
MNVPADPTAALAASRAAITAAYRADETAWVAALAREIQTAALDSSAVAERATGLVAAVRRQRQGASGVDNLMHEFSLSSQEGIALMCLAEALLRIPDDATVDRLIRDKISKGDWRAHLGRSESLFVNAATWGLMITGRLVATRREASLGNALTRLIARGGEPLIRRGVEFAMTLLGQQFVMGETIDAALARSQDNIRKGYTHSFDMLGEAALTTDDAERYFHAYEQAIHTIGRSAAGRGVFRGPGISVKLSALHPRYSRAQRERVLAELYPRLLALAKLARRYDIGFNIDSEEADRLDLSQDLLDRLAFAAELDGWAGLAVAVQAYQKRALPLVDHLSALARASGRRLMVRLVKGAYWDGEIKRAQVDGLEGYPVYTRKDHTDLSYLVCARRLLAAAEVIYPQFATHNAHTLAAVERMAIDLNVTDYEFQCLHGMGETLYDNVVSGDRPGGRCRIYAPVGRHETLLPYLVRRLLENGANSSFVNRLVDEKVKIEELVVDPLAAVRKTGGSPHPAIPLPGKLYGDERRNSAGLDLSDERVLEQLTADLEHLKNQRWEAGPRIAAGSSEGGPGNEIRNPAERGDIVGTARDASPADIERALAAAADYAETWHRTPPAERGQSLRRAAELLEVHRPELISLCIREAGKTWANAVAEIREAVDFCRYYAVQAERLAPPDGPAPGVVACISPWNFPLAIFIGQVAAALAAGSPVVAKPAEQTPLIAAQAARWLHEAGIPPAALQLLPGRGETVGAALTADPRVRGVIFTGSLEVAQLINRALAARDSGEPDLRLIAETGGQNAMIVDSSALAEQVVLDVISSGFDSAGQRCSALRVLCLQQEIADSLLALLLSAMRELTVGNPAELSTDVGPVIDAAAKDGLKAHIAAMRQAGHAVYPCELPAACTAGIFVPPTLIEIDRIDELQREVFGPVVHVLRYASDRLDETVDAINAAGYGLTFGAHSRIDETIQRLASRIHAGNIYINRNMVGAVVGVQPFGGEGQSGTGPKAGGPFYLPRLLELAHPALETLGLHRSADADPRLAALESLTAWSHRQGLRPLALACAEYATATPLPCHGKLPGPTGEDNTLSFAPRGDVFCQAASESALLEQLAAALATGNTPLISEDAPAAAIFARLPVAVQEVIRRAPNAESARPAAILFDGDRQTLAELRRRVAAWEGPLIPVIRLDPTTKRYPLYRLTHERVISINTAAAGGNTSLLTLTDSTH